MAIPSSAAVLRQAEVAVQTSSSFSKRRTLNFVKCEKCRRDKQACLPYGRVWPDRCEWCKKCDAPCSTGVRKVRKKRSGAHSQVQAAPVVIEAENGSTSQVHEVPVATGLAQTTPAAHTQVSSYVYVDAEPATKATHIITSTLENGVEEQPSTREEEGSDRDVSDSFDGGGNSGINVDVDAVTSMPSPDSMTEAEELNTKVDDWLAAVNIYKGMVRANTRLRSLTHDIREILNQDYERAVSLIEYPIGFQQIENFVKLLGRHVVGHTHDVITLKPVTVTSHLATIGGSLLSDVLLGEPNIYDRCLLCLSNFRRVADTLRHQLVQNRDKGTLFMLETEQWTGHALHCSHNERYPGFQHIWHRYQVSSRAVEATTKDVIQVMQGYWGRFEVPAAFERHPRYVPDVLSRYPLARSDELDCLGRTWLHRYLDIEEISSSTKDKELQEIESEIESLGDIDARDVLMRTALHIACEKSHYWVACKLVTLGADVTAATVFKMTPLHFAAASGSWGICEKLLSCERTNVNAEDLTGCTPLHYAARHGHRSVQNLINEDKRSIEAWQCQSKVCRLLERGYTTRELALDGARSRRRGGFV